MTGAPENPEERSLPAAGWYADPERPGMRRYWDGAEWTEQRETAGGGSGETPGAGDIDRRFKALRTAATVFHVLGWVIAIGGSLAVIAAAIAAGEDSNVAGSTSFNEGDADPAAILIFGAIGVFLYSLFAFAAAGMIRLMIAVEDNTRRTADGVERMLASGR